MMALVITQINELGVKVQHIQVSALACASLWMSGLPSCLRKSWITEEEAVHDRKLPRRECIDRAQIIPSSCPFSFIMLIFVQSLVALNLFICVVVVGFLIIIYTQSLEIIKGFCGYNIFQVAHFCKI